MSVTLAVVMRCDCWSSVSFFCFKVGAREALARSGATRLVCVLLVLSGLCCVRRWCGRVSIQCCVASGPLRVCGLRRRYRCGFVRCAGFVRCCAAQNRHAYLLACLVLHLFLCYNTRLAVAGVTIRQHCRRLTGCAVHPAHQRAVRLPVLCALAAAKGCVCLCCSV